MPLKYFELCDDLHLSGRWHLSGVRDDTGKEVESRFFRYGRNIDTGFPLRLESYEDSELVEVALPLHVEFRYEGKPLDFTFAAFDMPVVTGRVAELLAKVASDNIQRFPAWVDGQDEPFEIINVRTAIDCIDTRKSKIMWWAESDERPDKTGKPRMISNLKILSDCVSGHHLFRLKDWEVALICSEVVKNAMEGANISGVSFREV